MVLDMEENINESMKEKFNLRFIKGSKGKEILAPDIISMNTEEINKWAIENKVKISYKEE